MMTTRTVGNSHERIPLHAASFGNQSDDEQCIDPVATMLWIECGSCSGESMAILGAEGPGKEGYNLLDFLEHNQVQLLWHPSLSMETPTELTTLIDRILAGDQELTFFCVEGSIIHGPHGTGMFDTLEGKPKKDIIRALCEKAEFVLAMGTCSSYGGIPAAPPNPTESSGLQFTNDRPGGLLDPKWRSGAGLPVLNLAGCPVDAATMIKTMSWILKDMPLELDIRNRPFTVGPCLSDTLHQKCGTSEKVGYSCYGCISARFPINKGMFRHVEHPEKEKPFDRTSEHTYMNYSRKATRTGVKTCG
jgi:uptake hydrogenase small subunit